MRNLLPKHLTNPETAPALEQKPQTDGVIESVPYRIPALREDLARIHDQHLDIYTEGGRRVVGIDVEWHEGKSFRVVIKTA